MRIFKLLILYVIVIAISSCMKDLGNYDYNDLNDVVISGFKPITDNSGIYVVEHSDMLEINPEINQTISNDQSKLSYVWKMGNDTIGTEKNLNFKVTGNFPFGNNSCLYVVTNDDNGMKYFKSFSVMITNPFSFGWYILTEKPDKLSEIAHLSTIKENPKFIFSDEVSGYKLGKPSKLVGSFGHISSLKDYFWDIHIITKDSEYPYIRTDNGTFMAKHIASTENFVDKEKGYVLNPEDFYISRSGATVFVSEGKTILMSNGLLYRPAKYTKDYNFTHITPNSVSSFIIALDKNINKLCIAEPVKDNIAEGIYGDNYAMDYVTEIDDFVDYSKREIVFITEPSAISANVKKAKVVSVSEQGIHFDSFTIDFQNGQLHEEDDFIGRSNLMSNTLALAYPNNYTVTSWFFLIGNTVYSSPSILPALTREFEIPSRLGIVTDMKLSAKSSDIVVSTYDKDSPNEYKGSLVIINIITKEMTIHENVMHKPVSILAADANPWW